MNCKHAIITGGDLVPYGSTSVQLPEDEECGHPNSPKIYYYDGYPCNETCPYYEAEEEDTK